MYDHETIEQALTKLGFEKVAQGNVKASYVKT
jgi:hypothetical protein